ncbi:Phospholipase A(1) DAD1, chloroplastic [Vitis vinifera]|uniref:Phospholipase A(1) DAD1, chloroplastic n=1 Tax=Vitis vinifera TaxID=29760 RepID=A0A438HJ36_VITVI|nr:Phospholipase A(1) DAD1, chloroplastic [Vitis vinifera]
MEYQGIRNWDGLLDPLDDKLRCEILRYGDFVDATYKALTSTPLLLPMHLPLPKNFILDGAGLPNTGYRPTRNLRATSGIQLPRWIKKASSWVATESSWIGYVAVCQDKEEIARLGRRDVCPFRLYGGERIPQLVHFQNSHVTQLQDLVREEVASLLQSYGDEPLSLTITGHSLGAALAILTAYDIKTTFSRAPLVTVVSFGGPRVGNRNFRCQLERQGTKILRIVNSDDLITKVPGFVIDDNGVAGDHDVRVSGLPAGYQSAWLTHNGCYADVGRELRLRSRDSPYLGSINVATCHDLRTYLHLVDGFVSSKCPFRPMIKKVINPTAHRRLGCRFIPKMSIHAYSKLKLIPAKYGGCALSGLARKEEILALKKGGSCSVGKDGVSRADKHIDEIALHATTFTHTATAPARPQPHRPVFVGATPAHAATLLRHSPNPAPSIPSPTGRFLRNDQITLRHP